MLLLVPTLLLAGVTSAQITTSMIYLESNLGTDKIGFYGSVIGASGGTTTLAVTFDNGTNLDGLRYGEINDTVTISPNHIELTQNVGRHTLEDGSPDPSAAGNNINIRCDAGVTPQLCTYSYGTSLAGQIQCYTGIHLNSTHYETATHTYSGRLSYSAGVETITRSIVYGPYTPRSTPSWCSDTDYVPTTGYVSTITMTSGALATYQVVVTAGLEKLRAASGASLGSSGPTPTGDGKSAGAAAPMRTAGPLLAGLGAAAAIFL